MATILNYGDLKMCLKEEDLFLTELIDTIPPKMYFDRDVQEQMVTEKHAHMDETIKELYGGSLGSHRAVSSKMKHKRARLDPLWQKSVSYIQEKISAETKKKTKKKVPFKSASLTRAENVEELQKRLQQKVDELQAKRRGCSAQEFLQRKQLRKEKKKLQKAKAARNFSKGNLHISNVQNNQLQKPVKEPFSKQMYNKDGKVIFSKFEFSEHGFKTKKDGDFSGKNYKKLLNSVEKEKEKIDKLREQDAMKAEEFVTKKAWKQAIEKAEGIKVKDDPVLLKKSLMKQEKRKRKSSEVWKEREESVEKKKKMQQEKRQKNIQNKKKEKLQVKLKRAKKKGRIISGF